MRWLALLLFGCGSVAPTVAPDAAGTADVSDGGPVVADASAPDVDAAKQCPAVCEDLAWVRDAGEPWTTTCSGCPGCECLGAGFGTLVCGGVQAGDLESCTRCGGHCLDGGAD